MAAMIESAGSSGGNGFGSNINHSNDAKHFHNKKEGLERPGFLNLGKFAAAFHTPTLNLPDASKLEYLFEDEFVANGPSWGSRICHGSGMTYLSGLAVGGTWGVLDGLRNRAGRTSLRLRWNCIINGCTARGPFVANSAGMLALLYNLIHGAVIKARGEKYDEWSAIGSATAAGLVFKSTAGLQKAGLGGLAMGSAMLIYQFGKSLYLASDASEY